MCEQNKTRSQNASLKCIWTKNSDTQISIIQKCYVLYWSNSINTIKGKKITIYQREHCYLVKQTCVCYPHVVQSKHYLLTFLRNQTQANIFLYLLHLNIYMVCQDYKSKINHHFYNQNNIVGICYYTYIIFSWSNILKIT